MAIRHFSSLADLVLLEIFGYLSCEDGLYAFADLCDFRIVDLLKERGMYSRICLSSRLSREKYEVLKQDIWRYELVRSFVCKEMFSDFVSNLKPCSLFPSLTKLRLLYVRYPSNDLAKFVIAHASTLTHFTFAAAIHADSTEACVKFLHTVLPHLNRLTFLDIDENSIVQVKWNQLAGCLPSLEQLFTYADNISNVYELAIDGFLPCLRSLSVCVNYYNWNRTIVQDPLPAVTSLHMPQLEKLSLSLRRDDDKIEWAIVEALTSQSIMPRLRQCTLIYDLSNSNEIRQIFASPLFGNDDRHVRVRFGLYLDMSVPVDRIDASKLAEVRSGRYNEIFVKYNNNDESKSTRMWLSPTWSSLMTFSVYGHEGAPRGGVRSLMLETPNISLQSIGQRFPDVHTLHLTSLASLCIDKSSLLRSPLRNVYRLTVSPIADGLEFLLDGGVLPRLRCIVAFLEPLFVALMRRPNQMKTLDGIDQLTICDVSETSFSLKHWHTVLDAFPRLQTLIVNLLSPMCPPMEMADVFVNYVRQTAQQPLVLLSFDINDGDNADSKGQVVDHLKNEIELVCPTAEVSRLSETILDVWM